MDRFADERDRQILETDKYTFFVLRRIMGGKCELLLTDHERLIICFTGKPFPIWIWTPDDATEAEMERAVLDGKTLSISLNMLAYDCRNPVKPTAIADGSIYQCNREDVEELVDFLDLFHKETGIDQKERNDYRVDAEAYINSGNMYLWKNKLGKNVASCKFVPDGNMASINFVLTRPEFRRRHYAENLVYQVTKFAMSEGYVPVLYTDADYIASNACYEKKKF